MTTKILINAIDPDECRIAIVKNSKLEGFHIESTTHEITHGNIYKGIVSRVEPGLQAVFVDYGAPRHGFLQKNEIHTDYFQDTADGNHSLKNVIKRGQEVLVQVTKDPVGNKGAMLTTYISLAGRYVVLLPGSLNRGISRKIEEGDERSRIKAIFDSLRISDGFGVIIRTASENTTKTRLQKDIRDLSRIWRDIRKNAMKETVPALVYKEQGLIFRSIRDYFTNDVTEILIDNLILFRELKDFISIFSPKHAKVVRLHKEGKPIFTKHQLEDQITSVFENRVLLKSGGSIVIEPTEALVSIDVNSGKGTHKTSIEQTAFRSNLEAVEEIARQLRLRDLGGLIVIDFIDMKDRKHKLDVEKALKTAIKEDRARIKIGSLSRFGLLEMSRQRLRPPVGYGSFSVCPECQGKGQVASIEMLGLAFLRKLQLETLKEEICHVRGKLPTRVADYLLNRKRRELAELEERRNLTIEIEGIAAMHPRDSEIICEKEEKSSL